jgi:hypothetical protein
MIPLDSLLNLLDTNDIGSIDALALYTFIRLKYPSLISQQRGEINDDK